MYLLIHASKLRSRPLSVNGVLSWWRHQMEIFSALLALCERDPPVTGGCPSQRPVAWIFDVFFDLRLNKGLSKPSRDAGELRRHRDRYDVTVMMLYLLQPEVVVHLQIYHCVPNNPCVNITLNLKKFQKEYFFFSNLLVIVQQQWRIETEELLWLWGHPL